MWEDLIIGPSDPTPRQKIKLKLKLKLSEAVCHNDKECCLGNYLISCLLVVISVWSPIIDAIVPVFGTRCDVYTITMEKV